MYLFLNSFFFFSSSTDEVLKFALAAIGRVEGLLDYNRIRADMSRCVFLLLFRSLFTVERVFGTFYPIACFSRRIRILRTTDSGRLCDSIIREYYSRFQNVSFECALSLFFLL